MTPKSTKPFSLVEARDNQKAVNRLSKRMEEEDALRRAYGLFCVRNLQDDCAFSKLHFLLFVRQHSDHKQESLLQFAESFTEWPEITFPEVLSEAVAAFDPDARPISPSSKGKNSNVTTKNEIDRHREELSQILKLKGLTVGHECFIDVNCILGEIEINSAAPYHLFLTPSFEIFAIDSNGSVLPVEMEVWGKLIYFIAAYEGKVSFTDSNWGNPLKGLVKPLLKQYNFYDKLNHKLRSVAITNLKELQENWEKAFKEMKEGEKISNANDALQKVLGQEWAYDFKLFALEKGSEEAKIVNPTTILLEKDFAKWWDKWETLKRQLPKKDSDLEKAVEFADSWLPLKLYGTLYHEVVAKDLHALEEALKQELDDVTIMEEYAKFHEDQKKEHGESNYLDYQLRVFAQSLMLKGYSQAFICGIFRNSDSKLTLE